MRISLLAATLALLLSFEARSAEDSDIHSSQWGSYRQDPFYEITGLESVVFSSSAPSANAKIGAEITPSGGARAVASSTGDAGLYTGGGPTAAERTASSADQFLLMMNAIAGFETPKHALYLPKSEVPRLKSIVATPEFQALSDAAGSAKAVQVALDILAKMNLTAIEKTGIVRGPKTKELLRNLVQRATAPTTQSQIIESGMPAPDGIGTIRGSQAS